MSYMTIAGLDPSLSNLGMCKAKYFFAEKQGSMIDLKLVSTEKTKIKNMRVNIDDLERSRKLYNALSEFLVDVDMVCVELPVGSQSSRAQTSYGVVLCLIASISKPVIVVTPDQVKLIATNTKTASKKDMISWGRSTFPELPWLNTLKDEHLADACAALLAGINTDQFKQYSTMLEKYKS